MLSDRRSQPARRSTIPPSRGHFPESNSAAHWPAVPAAVVSADTTVARTGARGRTGDDAALPDPACQRRTALRAGGAGSRAAARSPRRHRRDPGRRADLQHPAARLPDGRARRARPRPPPRHAAGPGRPARRAGRGRPGRARAPLARGGRPQLGRRPPRGARPRRREPGRLHPTGEPRPRPHHRRARRQDGRRRVPRRRDRHRDALLRRPGHRRRLLRPDVPPAGAPPPPRAPLAPGLPRRRVHLHHPLAPRRRRRRTPRVELERFNDALHLRDLDSAERLNWAALRPTTP